MINKPIDIILKDLLDDINNWLKYSETKNTILATILGGFIISFFEISNSSINIANMSISNADFYIKIYLFEILLLLPLAFFILLISFYPQTKSNICWFRNRDIKEDDNLIFYGDISKYNAEEYQKLIIEKYDINKDKIGVMERQYINQIIINSRITYRKNKYTKIAIFLVISAFITLPVALIIREFLE